MNLKQIFGKNVKYYRFQKHYTQEKLAALVGVSTNDISRLELGKHNPSLMTIDKLANALNIEPADLFLKNNKTPLPIRVDMIDN